MGERRVNFDLVKEIFEQAIDVPLVDREHFVITAANGDNEVIKEVQSLLSCTSEDDDAEEILDPMIGMFAGPWKIEERIGGGGMGRVYYATNPKTNKRAAIKVLRRLLVDRSAAKRFEQEIRVLGRLDHAGIARIKGAGTIELEGDRVPWIAMELIEESVPITTYAKNKPMEVKLALLRDTCLAVGEAHTKGIIHRDVKPSNILVNKNGEVKIIDFGIAKVIDDTIRPTGLHTQTGGLLGTLQYMAPESCAQGSVAQTTSDVYSLGIIMYEMLSGHRPYEVRGDSVPSLVQAMSTTDPTPIGEKFPAYKGSVAAVVHKALARNPRNRYSSANEFATDLQHLIDGAPVTARPEPYFVRMIRKHRTAAAVLAITIPILVAATAVSTYFAISANQQLVRNEKMLAFAKDAMQVQKEILHQHSEYWETHVSNAKMRADELTPGDLLLRVEMYEALGGHGKSKRGTCELYKEAHQILVNELGENDSQTLLIEAKYIDSGALLRPDGGRDTEASVLRLQNILSRWNSGTPEEHSELLYLVSRIELASKEEKIRKLGHKHAKESERIARSVYVTGENEKLVIQPVGKRIWSLIFMDGDEVSLTKAIELIKKNALPLLRSRYKENDIRVLKATSFLAIAHLERSNYKDGKEQLVDINDALKLNEFVVDEIVKQSGDGYNTAWQVMNNLALCLVAKAEYFEEFSENNRTQIRELKTQASELWSKILQQSQFKKGDSYDVHEWYLATYQESLPQFAPTNEQWSDWLRIISTPPTRN
jgi:tRNA A-37 threonylcarbamoyl transferase component Bud32